MKKLNMSTKKLLETWEKLEKPVGIFLIITLAALIGWGMDAILNNLTQTKNYIVFFALGASFALAATVWIYTKFVETASVPTTTETDE